MRVRSAGEPTSAPRPPAVSPAAAFCHSGSGCAHEQPISYSKYVIVALLKKGPEHCAGETELVSCGKQAISLEPAREGVQHVGWQWEGEWKLQGIHLAIVSLLEVI